MTEQEYINYFIAQMPTNTFEYDELDDLVTMLMMLNKHNYLGALDWGVDEAASKHPLYGIVERRVIQWVSESTFTIVGKDYPPATMHFKPLTTGELSIFQRPNGKRFADGTIAKYEIRLGQAQRLRLPVNTRDAANNDSKEDAA